MDDDKFDLEKFPTSDSANRMISYVSDGFYDNSYVGKWLYQVMGLEYDSARQIAEDLPNQFFPETATWGLMYHEIKWGLPVRENLSYEERRKLIYQKRDQRAPMTPYRMEIYLKNATGFEVHVCDSHDPGSYGFNFSHPNIFKAVFIGEGTLDVKKAKDLLDKKLKQSHTTYTLNDRVITVLDNRNLERMVLRNIRLKMQVPFWNCNLFDGSWKFDGSILLDAQRRYDLILGLKYTEGEFVTTERADIHLLAMRSKTELSERFKDARAILRFGINFWKGLRFDGSWKFDGTKFLNNPRHGMKTSTQLQMSMEARKEEIGSVTVTTRRNLWYFDGSIKMDGSRLLNSINRKEAL